MTYLFQDHVRKIEWTNDRDVSKFNGQPIKAVIEHVRDGSTVRAFLMPEDNTFYYITLMLSGIRVSNSVQLCNKDMKFHNKIYIKNGRYAGSWGEIECNIVCLTCYSAQA